MRTTKHLALGAMSVMALVGLMLVLFIWPNYRQARAVRAQVADLQARASTLESRAKAVDRLADEVRAAREHVANDFKVIPESADVAGLIRKLSDTIDGVNVVDQTFTAGTPGEAIIGSGATPVAANSSDSAKSGGGSKAMATPVAADMRATFESVFALLRKAESMDRLVRIASVRLLCKREEQKTTVPVLAASVSLEVIYQPADANGESK